MLFFYSSFHIILFVIVFHRYLLYHEMSICQDVITFKTIGAPSARHRASAGLSRAALRSGHSLPAASASGALTIPGAGKKLIQNYVSVPLHEFKMLIFSK